jgi:hypothetical protein
VDSGRDTTHRGDIWLYVLQVFGDPILRFWDAPEIRERAARNKSMMKQVRVSRNDGVKERVNANIIGLLNSGVPELPKCRHRIDDIG